MTVIDEVISFKVCTGLSSNILLFEFNKYFLIKKLNSIHKLGHNIDQGHLIICIFIMFKNDEYTITFVHQ